MAVACLLGGLSAPVLARYLTGHAVPGELGTVGDWVGGTSAPLLSLAGFFLVLAAFYAQQAELTLTRREMKHTRQEFKAQNSTLKRQRFENTFFNLLQNHHQIVDSLGRGSARGRQKIYDVYNHLFTMRHQILENQERGQYKSVGRDLIHLLVVVPAVFDEADEDLGHYFRNLYHLVRLVDSSPLLSDQERVLYSRIIRAQLSAREQVLLFYNAMIDGRGHPKFRELIDRHDLLQHLQPQLLLERSDEQRYTHGEAFPRFPVSHTA
jgi:hypothetical protein